MAKTHNSTLNNSSCYIFDADASNSHQQTRHSAQSLQAHGLCYSSDESSQPIPHRVTTERLTQEGVIDYVVLYDTLDSMGDEQHEELAVLLEIYTEDTPSLVNQMRAAVAQQDADRLGTAAHRLKSSSATLGAISLTQLCQQLETMAQFNDLTDSAAVFSQIETAYAIFLTTLSKYYQCLISG